jgi:hypothetical protein
MDLRQHREPVKTIGTTEIYTKHLPAALSVTFRENRFCCWGGEAWSTLRTETIRVVDPAVASDNPKDFPPVCSTMARDPAGISGSSKSSAASNSISLPFRIGCGSSPPDPLDGSGDSAEVWRKESNAKANEWG